MKRPFLQDETLLADIAARRMSAGARLWWLGQSGFLLHHAGEFLCIDPYLSDSLTEKYAESDKPHVRISARVVSPSALSMVNTVTSSHNHTDHLDAATIGPMRKANPNLTIVVPEANRAFAAERLGVAARSLECLDDGESIRLGRFRITAIASAHEELETDPSGRHRFLGYIIEAGMSLIYHSGDCVPYPGLLDRIRRFKDLVMLLPINGRLPERRVAGNFWGKEAAQLAKDARARLVIPCHYDMFEFNTVSPGEFVAECERLSQPYRVLRLGEGISL